MIPIEELTIAAALEKRARYKPTVPDAQELSIFAVPDLLTGVEIELEDWNDDAATADYCLSAFSWTEHEEGSLRNGREFVLQPPKNGNDLSTSIDGFFNYGATWIPSERASVHVHLDMLNGVTVAGFRSMFMLFYALEGAIYRVADENRKWASYSCPLIDLRADRLAAILAASTVGSFKKALVGNYHEEKYYGFNAVSLSKHGTIELRYFPCTTNKDTLIAWINLCQEMYAAAVNSNIPTLSEQIRQQGVVAFVRKHLPRSAESLLAYVDVQEVLHRVAECVAIYTDANANKPHRWLHSDADITNEAYIKMFNNVCAPVVELRKKKQELDVVEVNTESLYRELLQAARANINNENGV